MPHYLEEDPDLAWEKPEWCKNRKLRPTGKADVLKTQGNLAKPITALPHTGEKDLSFQKPEWTANSKLSTTKQGEKLKTSGNLARPIYGIKPIES